MKIFLVEIYVVFSKLPYFSFSGLLQNLQKSLTWFSSWFCRFLGIRMFCILPHVDLTAEKSFVLNSTLEQTCQITLVNLPFAGRRFFIFLSSSKIADR